jgi:MFS transporter (putative signal transducer)
MMSWCGPEQTGTDFAILQSLDALIAIVMALAAGWIGERFGHGANFGIAGLVMLLAAGMAMRRTAHPLRDLSPSGTPS